MLEIINKERLEKLKADIKILKLRFPVSVIAKRMGMNMGNVSNYLRGMRPMSEKFFYKFYDVFGEDLEAAIPGARGKFTSVVEEEHQGFNRVNESIAPYGPDPEIEKLKKENASLHREIESRLSMVLAAVETLSSQQAKILQSLAVLKRQQSPKSATKRRKNDEKVAFAGKKGKKMAPVVVRGRSR